MSLLAAILLGLTGGVFSIALWSLAASAIAKRGHIVRGSELWRLFSEDAGNPKEGVVPPFVQAPPDWLQIPAWSGDLLAKDNLFAGARHRLTGQQLALWAFLQGKRYLFLALVVATLGPAVVALASDSQFAVRASFMVAAVLAGIGVFAIFAFRRDLAAQAKARQALLRNALPYTTDFLVLMLDAGGDFNSALEAYLVHGPVGPMRDELHLVLQEIRTGASRVEALQRLAQRNPIQEIERLVLVVAQSERMGTPIAETLRDQAELLRMERTQRAAETAERMSIDSQVWVALMGIAIMLLLMGPFLLSMGPGLQGIFR